MPKTIIEFIGPTGSGKSVLSRLLAKTLHPDNSQRAVNILLIDACVDQGLTYQCIPKGEWASLGQTQTLTQLVQHLIEHEARYRLKGIGPIQRQEAQQSLDWAFSNLPNSVALGAGTEVDLLTVGILTEHLPNSILESLSYGLKRLLKTYDYVVVDGYHPLLHPVLLSLNGDSNLATVVVTRSNDDELFPKHLQLLKTPALLVTQFRGETFSPAIQKALADQDIKLIGKIPPFTIEDMDNPIFIQQFHDCLHFLDVPLFNS